MIFLFLVKKNYDVTTHLLKMILKQNFKGKGEMTYMSSILFYWLVPIKRKIIYIPITQQFINIITHNIHRYLYLWTWI